MLKNTVKLQGQKNKKTKQVCYTITVPKDKVEGHALKIGEKLTWTYTGDTLILTLPNHKKQEITIV